MKTAQDKSPIAVSTIIFYVAAVIVLLIGAAYLVINVRYYNTMVAGYVAQGYAAADVTSQLIPQKLLPGIFEPVGLFGGIAAVLWGIGLLSQKLSLVLAFNDSICCCCDEEEAEDETASDETATEEASEEAAPEESSQENDEVKADVDEISTEESK